MNGMELVGRSRPVGLVSVAVDVSWTDTHTETDHAHDDHGNDVDYGPLQPLSKLWSGVQVVVAVGYSFLGWLVRLAGTP